MGHRTPCVFRLSSPGQPPYHPHHALTIRPPLAPPCPPVCAPPPPSLPHATHPSPPPPELLVPTTRLSMPGPPRVPGWILLSPAARAASYSDCQPAVRQPGGECQIQLAGLSKEAAGRGDRSSRVGATAATAPFCRRREDSVGATHRRAAAVGRPCIGSGGPGAAMRIRGVADKAFGHTVMAMRRDAAARRRSA